MMDTIELQVMTDALRGYSAGQKVKVKVDRDSVPVDAFWRRRMMDSAIDGCVEVVPTVKRKTLAAKEATK